MRSEMSGIRMDGQTRREEVKYDRILVRFCPAWGQPVFSCPGESVPDPVRTVSATFGKWRNAVFFYADPPENGDWE